jgi:hypothetical protein
MGAKLSPFPVPGIAGVVPVKADAVVVASAWQPKRGRKVGLEESPSIAKRNTAMDSPEKVPPNVSPRYACLEARLVDPSDQQPAGGGAGAVLSFIATCLDVGDGERQDQNPSLATVKHEGVCLWWDRRAPRRASAADRTRLFDQPCASSLKARAAAVRLL